MQSRKSLASFAFFWGMSLEEYPTDEDIPVSCGHVHGLAISASFR